MRIDKALEHFVYKFKHNWKPTERDVEAFNSILEWKETQENKKMFENELLAKLWIHQLMLLNTTNMYSAERAIQVIDEILDRELYEWCDSLRRQIPFLRFNAVLSDDNYKEALRHGNLKKVQEIESVLLKTKEKELIESLQSEISIEDIIKFVQKHISRILNKHG